MQKHPLFSTICGSMAVKTKDDVIFWTIWITCAAFGSLFLVWYFLLGQPALPGCRFYQWWHIYCPGCGGTRAVIALIEGDVLRSLYYHPAVGFTAASVLFYQSSQLIWRLRGKRGRVLHYSDKWLWTMGILLLAHCALRNVLWFLFGIPL